jgi:DNA-binding response OmpR family regulator
MIKRTKYTLLFVEDEAMIRKIAVAVLQPYFLEIYEAKDGVEALEIYSNYKPDIIITDIEMPNMNGLALCKKIREKDKTTPIIVTTAYTKTDYLLEAISLNLVKYLVKPIEEEALFEALRFCFEAIERHNPSMVKISKTHTFDMLNHTLIENKENISLTESQYKLLSILIKNQGRIVSYEEIENYVWFDRIMSTDALRSLVRDVRKFIGKETIVNISKYGYRIHLYG